MEYTLKIKKIKTPTDANWVTTIPTEYTNIKGRVYNIVKVADGGKSKYDKNGYWQANADLMDLINPFTNPISNKSVTETKIELVYKDIYGWEESTSEKMYFDFLVDQCIIKIQKIYKELYGVQIDFLIIKDSESKSSATNNTATQAPISATNSEVKSVTAIEPTSATSSTDAGTTASNTGTASNAGATSSNIAGEFIFNVEQENLFIGVNNQFGTLSVIGIGEIKEEPVDKPEEELLDEEGLDEEYQEEAFQEPEEGAMAYPSAQVYQNDIMDELREPDGTTTGGGKVFSKTKYNGSPGAAKFKGHVKKDTLDDRVLFDIMIKAIEGGYYHPTHLPGNSVMANSGETLWGIDRYASTNENTNLGQKFWRIVDKISGYGDLSGGGSDFSNSKNWAKDVNGDPIKRSGSEGNPAYFKQNGVILQGYKWGDVKNQPYARIHSTSKWNFKKRPSKSTKSGTKNNGVWGHCYNPNIKDYPEDYPVLRDAALEYANSTKKTNFSSYFNGYDELVNTINNDGRLKFLWLRSCWNGTGFFKNFAAGAKKAWDSGVKNADDLIVHDLNNRLTYAAGLNANSKALITKDCNEIAGLIGL